MGDEGNVKRVICETTLHYLIEGRIQWLSWPKNTGRHSVGLSNTIFDHSVSHLDTFQVNVKRNILDSQNTIVNNRDLSGQKVVRIGRRPQ